MRGRALSPALSDDTAVDLDETDASIVEASIEEAPSRAAASSESAAAAQDSTGPGAEFPQLEGRDGISGIAPLPPTGGGHREAHANSAEATGQDVGGGQDRHHSYGSKAQKCVVGSLAGADSDGDYLTDAAEDGGSGNGRWTMYEDDDGNPYYHNR